MSETAPEAAPAETPDTGTEAPQDSTATLAAEVDKWKSLAQKHEQRAKSNAQAAQEFERFRQASMTEQERAVETARAEAANEVTLRFAGRLVEAEFRAATAGRMDSKQVNALLAKLDRSQFLTEDGEVDSAAVQSWVDDFAPPPTDPATAVTPFGLGQGVRGGTPLALNDDGLTEKLARAVGARR